MAIKLDPDPTGTSVPLHHERSQMTLAKNMVVTCEPDGTKPRLRFFHSPESAHDHAQMICRDLNRDAYVGTVTHRFLASRKTWAAQKEAQNVQ